MSVISISSPVSGAAITGLTSPTYTLTQDTSPNGASLRYIVSALGGTQTGVDTHSVSKPFILEISRPKSVRTSPSPNPTTGVISGNPKNRYHVRIIKGVDIDSTGDNKDVSMFDGELSIPASAELQDSINIRAALSLLGGVLWAEAGDFATMFETGVL